MEIECDQEAKKAGRKEGRQEERLCNVIYKQLACKLAKYFALTVYFLQMSKVSQVFMHCPPQKQAGFIPLDRRNPTLEICLRK